MRIDPIGSTAVEGLDAKPVVDIQISIASFAQFQACRERIEAAGFLFREGNPDLTKRYFRELPGARRTHIHVREAGSFAEQAALLFRDYLRSNPDACRRYAAGKHRLMALFKEDRPAYVEGKGADNLGAAAGSKQLVADAGLATWAM
ncbi:GrpB family protein [Paenibacillus humicus]|uniref:GrpB family protein n=1 Tax=Paenibacillus humicus TaxID=412861 RepID=UPI003F5CCE4B